MISNYDYQKEANISCLLEDVEYEERKEVFFKIITNFSKSGIVWGIACSMNLFLRGIVDEFHDLDLIVDGEDIHKVKKIMDKLGARIIGTGGNGYCESEHYYHYQLGRVDIDVISGFKVRTFGTEFIYRIRSKEVDYTTLYEEKKVHIPMIPLEALYILYSMMEGWQPRRRYKRILIQEYLKKENILFRNILEDALTEEIPSWIKRNIRSIIILD